MHFKPWFFLHMPLCPRILGWLCVPHKVQHSPSESRGLQCCMSVISVPRSLPSYLLVLTHMLLWPSLYFPSFHELVHTDVIRILPEIAGVLSGIKHLYDNEHSTHTGLEPYARSSRSCTIETQLCYLQTAIVRSTRGIDPAALLVSESPCC